MKRAVSAAAVAAAAPRGGAQRRAIWWARRQREKEADEQRARLQSRVRVQLEELEPEVEASTSTSTSTSVTPVAEPAAAPAARAQGQTAAAHANEKFNTPLFAAAPRDQQVPLHPAEAQPPRQNIELKDMPDDPMISFIRQGKQMLEGIDDGGDCRIISETGVEGVWCLQLENLGEGNAITGEMMMKLEEAMRMVNRAIKTNHEIMALIIRGSGLNFSYGTAKSIHHELPSGEEGMILSRYMSSILLELKTLPIVTIAAMEGVTAGSAAELALACDFRIAAEDAMMQFTDISNGITPGWGGASNLADITSPRTALLLTASGKPVTPEEGQDLGVIDCITKAGDTYNEAISFVKNNLHDHSGLGGQYGETTWRRHSVRRMKENVVASSLFAASPRAYMDIEARNFQVTWEKSAKMMSERRSYATGLKRASINVALEDWATLTDPHAMSLPLNEDVGHGLFPTQEDSKFGLLSRNVESAFTSMFERKANQPLLNSPQSESFVKHKYMPDN